MSAFPLEKTNKDRFATVWMNNAWERSPKIPDLMPTFI